MLTAPLPERNGKAKRFQCLSLWGPEAYIRPNR
jgi:hypothetical protein